VNPRGARSTLIVLALLGSGAARAQIWQGPANGSWSTGANWQGGSPPSGSSTVTFNGASTSVLDLSFTVPRLNANGSGVVGISASGGAALTISGSIGISQPGVALSLNVSAPIIISGTQSWTFNGPSNTFSGNISGSGFSKLGSGTLILSGTNTFSLAGVSAGTLQATTSGALGTGSINLSNATTLRLSGSSAVASSVTVNVIGNSTLVVEGGGAHSLDSLTVAGAALTVTSGGGSSLSITRSLGGTGTLSGAVNIPSGSNLDPASGDTTGTLAIDTLTLSPTANLNYTVGTSTALVTITAPLTVNGIVNITDDGTIAQGTYTLIHSAGTMTAGTVSLGTPPDTANFSYGLAVNGNDLQLTVGPAPTAVGMATLDARHDARGSSVTWLTGFETRNLGYHVYRQEGASRRLLTPGLIAGSALRASGALKVGHSYAWLDRTAPTGGTYWIESIDMDGKRGWFGPITTRAGPTAAEPSSALLSDSRPSPVLTPEQPLIRILNGDSRTGLRDVNRQWKNAAGPAAKVAVRDPGVYRIPAEQLFASGIPSGVATSELRLWSTGTPVAFRAVTADGAHLQPGDAIEFYGRGLDTRYSDTRTYWVTTGGGPQRLLATVAPSASLDAGRSFPETMEARERLYYFSAVKNGGGEKFFGPQVSTAGLTRVFSTPALDVLSSSPGTLEVAVQGLSAGVHTISVTLNGVALKTLTGKNRDLMRATVTLPAGLLVAGDNTVRLAAQSDSDIDVESYQRLTYPRTYAGMGTPLTFTAGPGSSVRLVDFPVASTRVLDVTDPDAAIELAVAVDPANLGGTVVNVPDSSGPHTLLAFSSADVRAAVQVESNATSAWHDFGGAQLVILAHSSLLSTLQPLIDQRRREGFTVAAIDVQDVYDEFASGEKDATAIRNFLQHAARNWAIPPRYLLLVGGATYDPRDYLHHPGLDLVPTNLIETVFLETGSDGAFGEGLAIGRWPVTSPAEAALVMNKTLGRVPLTGQSSVLLVHDRDDTTRFSQATAEVRAALSAWPLQDIARGADTDAAVNASVLAAIRGGPAALDYQGHGAEDFWAGHTLSVTDTPALSNAGQSLLFSAATCFNGYFVDIGRSSLATAMLLTEGGGAWAAWASSGMTSPVEHSRLSADLLQAAMVDGLTLGDASVRAKSTLRDADVRATFHLFGDPSARMAPASTSLTAPPGLHASASTGCGTPGGPWSAALVLLLLPLLWRPQRTVP
jgi:autotransporter-associated beta strand protein